MGKVSVVILAAGKGKRMKKNINKQYLLLNDKPVLSYTIAAFEKNDNIDEIIVVAAKDEIEYCVKNIIEKYKFKKVTDVIAGGEERKDSVLNGLKILKDCEIVLIHDGARPFVNDRIIDEGIEYAKKYGACTCGVSPKDTIKVKGNDGFAANTLDRESLFLIQTPQCFSYPLIKQAHESVENTSNQYNITDDTMVAELAGHKVYLYEGDYNNIKITTPEDIYIGCSILEGIKSWQWLFTNV